MISKNSKLLAVSFALTSCLISSSLSLPALAVEGRSAAPPVVEETIQNKPFQVSKIAVNARPDQVWAILTDYHSAPLVFPTVKKCQLLADKGSTKVVHHEVRPSGVMKNFAYQLELKEHGHHKLEWRRVSGDFKEVEGFWKLEPTDGGRRTLVTYASYVNGGFWMPQALIKRQFRIDMPAVMTALKSHAEKTVHLASRKTENRTP